MRETDCDRMRDDIKAYLDHELTPLRRWSVARHLASCAVCRAEANEMAQITEELTRDEAETLDPTLRNRLVNELSSATPPVTRRRNNPLPAIVATASIAAVVIAIFFPVFAGVREKARLSSYAPAATQIVRSPQDSIVRRDSQSYIGSISGATASANIPAGHQTRNIKIAASEGFKDKDKSSDANSFMLNDDESLGRRIHKTATIAIQVSDPEAGSEKIEDMVKSSGGFVTSSNLTTDGDGIKTSQLSIKVPLPQFETSLAQIAKLGSVTAKNVTGEDITQKVSDADQRQVVLEQDMSQAQEQLRKKGSKAGWELQEDVRDLRIQLAQARARLKILKSLSELSEIEITLSQPPKAAPPVQTGFLSDIGNSGHSALQSSLGALSTLIALVFWILAYAPLWIPALLIGRWTWRAYQKRVAATM